METTSSNSTQNLSQARPRSGPNPWILLAIFLILALAFLIFEFHIRQNVEGPGHGRQDTTLLDVSPAKPHRS